MSDPTDLRDRLDDLADQARPTEGYEARVLARAHRLRARRRFTGAAAAAVCVALLVTVFRLVAFEPAPHLVVAPPDGPFLGWSPAGEVDAALVREATGVWDRAGSAGPYTAVHVLAATHNVHLHSVVVLEGYDKRHEARLAFFTSDTGAADGLRLRADRPAPDPATTRVVSLVSPRLTGPVGLATRDYWGCYGIAVAMPGVTTLRVLSTTIDQQLVQDAGAFTGRLVVQSLPLAATAPTVTVVGLARAGRIFARAAKVFEVPGDGGADGDATAVRAEVVRRDGRRIVVAVPDGGTVRPGQFAVVADGLVGPVAAVDAVHGEATIDLITGAAFTSPAYTNISNVPGVVRGTGGKLLMQRIPAGDKMDVYQGNRVVVPDPVQHSAQIGVVTVGRATDTKPAGADSVELTPTADLAHLHDIWIMTP